MPQTAVMALGQTPSCIAGIPALDFPPVLMHNRCVRPISGQRLVKLLSTAAVMAVGASACDGAAFTTRPLQRQGKTIGFASDPDGDVNLLIRRSHREDLPLDGFVIAFDDQPKAWADKEIGQSTRAGVLDDARTVGAANSIRLRESFLQWQTGQDPGLGDAQRHEWAVASWRLAGETVTAARLEGLFLDPLPYVRGTWKTPAALTPAAARVAAKQRGLDVGRAFYAQAPEAVVVLAVGYSEVFRQVCLGPSPVSLEDSAYTLYPAFLDGLFAARDEATARPPIIDAFLPSYITRQPEAFQAFRSLMHFRWDDLVASWTPGIQTLDNTDPEDPQAVTWQAQAPALGCSSSQLLEVARDVPAAMSIWLDAPASLSSFATFSATDYSQNWFSPMAAAAALAAARQATDNYVFLWSTETPWFPLRGGPTLPKDYLEALRPSQP